MKKNRKKVFTRPLTPQQNAELAWKDFEFSLLQVLLSVAACGFAVAVWMLGCNWDLTFVAAWSMGIGSPSLICFVAACWEAVANYLEWSDAQEVVYAIPRNRRVRKHISWFDWGGWVQ